MYFPIIRGSTDFTKHEKRAGLERVLPSGGNVIGKEDGQVR